MMSSMTRSSCRSSTSFIIIKKPLVVDALDTTPLYRHDIVAMYFSAADDPGKTWRSGCQPRKDVQEEELLVIFTFLEVLL